MEQQKELGNLVATRLKQTYRDPAEWIGTLRNGSRIHIVCDKTNYRIAQGINLGEALMKAKTNDVLKVPHRQITTNVSTEKMLHQTGLNVGPEVVINEVVLGD
jgi:hypothetical protein